MIMLTLLFRFSANPLPLQRELKFPNYSQNVLLINIAGSRICFCFRHFEPPFRSFLNLPGVVLYTSLNASIKTGGRHPAL